MNQVKTRQRPAPLYDTDYFAWTQDQAARLREVRPNSIDWENVAEEVESLGRSQRNEIRSRMRIALLHLLKWAYQPEERTNSWKASILGARDEILSEIEDSPSLRSYPARVLDKQYTVARLDAAGETKLDLATFPEKCPFTIGEVLDPDFYPDLPAR